VTPPGRAPAARVPALDGVRAVSILLVLLHHASGTTGAPQWLETVGSALDAGNLGVRVFFVISGYLITGLLMRELAATGTISLRTFYWRRTLRIFPPAYVFLATLALLTAAGVVALTPRELLAGATYTINFVLGEWTPRTWSIGHLWSLAVEEQFYLLWPALLILLTPRRAVWLLAGIAVLVPALRVRSLFTALPSPVIAVSPFLWYADWLGAGALLALLRPRLQGAQWYRTLRASDRWLVLTVVGGIVAWTALGHWRLREITSVGTIAAVAFLVDVAATERASVGVRLLSLPPLVWIGRISYSLYLWQEVFLNRYDTRAWTSFPLNVLLAFAAAAASYYAVERPVLTWRDRARHVSRA
jgi:peptidoglycan/LPS O-acetylase OafA/YrhL